ncbi:MAG: glucokinase, partial [Hyphomicrobiales bacterium]|nr:glucokinase [Hyphomicrobiales bacterium]
PDAPLGAPVHLKTGDYPGLIEAAREAFVRLRAEPLSLIACGAGPALGRRLKLSNAAWDIDGAATAEALRLDDGLLLNDFEAQALSLPALHDDWTMRIGPVTKGVAGGPRVILGPGTGLGIGALIESGGKHIPVSSEACHADFGPVDDEEAAIWRAFERVHGRITTEAVMSGPGLARLHAARLAVAGAPPEGLDSAGVVAAANADAASRAADTARLFWRIVARFSGDMAITFVATGGVTLSGGMLPRLKAFVDPATFRAAFEDKAPIDFVKRTPTRMVVHDDSVLHGMAAIAARPEIYAIDYAGRGWR